MRDCAVECQVQHGDQQLLAPKESAEAEHAMKVRQQEHSVYDTPNHNYSSSTLPVLAL
jgi:hypothetical protein